MILSKEEINLILELLREKYGPGYSEEKEVAVLQTKLSLMLEMCRLKDVHKETQEDK